MSDRTQAIRATFSANCRSVAKLTNLDRTIQTLLLTGLRHMNDVLTKPPFSITDNDKINGKRLIDIVEGLRSVDSLRSHFSEEMNQAIVLQVSYFASAVNDLFRVCVINGLESGNNQKLMDEDFKTTLGELASVSPDFPDAAADLFLSKQDISFQDMGSISRVFSKYFSIVIDRDRTVNNIIAAQACRNSIVHAGAIASHKTIGQLATAVDRDLKSNLGVGDRIDFSVDELRLVADTMKVYVENLACEIDEADHAV